MKFPRRQFLRLVAGVPLSQPYRASRERKPTLLIAVAVSSGWIRWFVLIGIVLLGITIARWLGSPTILALDAAHAARDRLERERATRAGAGASAPREHPSKGGLK